MSDRNGMGGLCVVAGACHRESLGYNLTLGNVLGSVACVGRLRGMLLYRTTINENQNTGHLQCLRSDSSSSLGPSAKNGPEGGGNALSQHD